MTSVNEVPRYKVRILKNFILRHFLFRFSYLNNKQKFFFNEMYYKYNYIYYYT